MAVTMEGNTESSKDMGHELDQFLRGNCRNGRVEMGRVMWKCDVSICDTGCNVFWRELRRGTRTIAVGWEAPVSGKESACLFPKITA